MLGDSNKNSIKNPTKLELKKIFLNRVLFVKKIITRKIPFYKNPNSSFFPTLAQLVERLTVDVITL